MQVGGQGSSGRLGEGGSSKEEVKPGAEREDEAKKRHGQPENRCKYVAGVFEFKLK